MLYRQVAWQISQWKEEHPLKMRPNDVLSPMDILKEINEQFETALSLQM